MFFFIAIVNLRQFDGDKPSPPQTDIITQNDQNSNSNSSILMSIERVIIEKYANVDDAIEVAILTCLKF